MPHARKQVRDAVIALVTGLTTTTTNVFNNRLYDFKEADLPCLNVLDLPDDESVELSEMSGKTNQRMLSLRIEGRAKATANLDDTLDLIASEVETVLDGAEPAGAKLCTLVSTSKQQSEGSQPHGLITLDFDISYNTVRGAPDTIV